MSNRVRYYLKNEVLRIIPKLHETYRAIGRYQKDRSERNREEALHCLSDTGEDLQVFQRHVQSSKQPYFDAVTDEKLNISDRIISLDTAVGAMHIEFPVSRSFSHRESQELRAALDRARFSEDDTLMVDTAGTTENSTICKGIPASPGLAIGKAGIVSRTSEYRRLPKGTIVVAKMIRPEISSYTGHIIGIVTDIGGSLCHAAIISREMGIPCVVGTQIATKVIKNKMRIGVDGSKGTVTRA